MVSIELVYALPDEQAVVCLKLPEGSTARQALVLSGLLEQYPEIDIEQQALGVFSKKVNLDYRLQAGDRLEIYRPLKIDPKVARRLRERKKKRNKS